MATYEITCNCGHREQIWVSVATDMRDVEIEKCPKCGGKLTAKMVYYDSATSHVDD